jgi:nucleoside-diphosphate-sugar epimerase
MTYKLIAVTGVTRGLGSVLTNWLIAQGKTVVGCARSQSGIDALGARFPSPTASTFWISHQARM